MTGKRSGNSSQAKNYFHDMACDAFACGWATRLRTRLGIASAERFFDLFPQRVFWSVAHNFSYRPPTTEENQCWASHNPVLVSQPSVVLVGEHIESYELDVLIFLSKVVQSRFHAATPVTSLMPEVDDYEPS